MASLTFALIEALIIGAKGVSIMSTLGKDIVIKTLSKTSGSVVNGITLITGYNDPTFNQVKSKFEEMDLKHTVEVIEDLVKEQDNFEEMQPSIKKAILGLNKILEKIDEEVVTINKDMEYHKSKYFNYYRTFNCSLNIKTIEKHQKILMKRYNLLIDLLKIYKVNENVNSNKNKQEKIQLLTEKDNDLC